MLAQLVICDDSSCGVEQRLVVENGVAILPDGWIQTVLDVDGVRTQLHFDTPSCMTIYQGAGLYVPLDPPALVTEEVQLPHRTTQLPQT